MQDPFELIETLSDSLSAYGKSIYNPGAKRSSNAWQVVQAAAKLEVERSVAMASSG